MNKIVNIVLCFTFFSSIAVYGQIGKSIKQLNKKLGKSEKLSAKGIKPPATAIYKFQKSGIEIKAFFIEKKCEQLAYYNARGFSRKMIKKILALNGEARNWAPTEKPQRFDGKEYDIPIQSWVRKDRNVFAYCYKNKILVFSLKYMTASMDANDKVDVFEIF